MRRRAVHPAPWRAPAEPPRTPLTPQVDYAWRVVHPGPDRVPIRAWERRIRLTPAIPRRGRGVPASPAAAAGRVRPQPSDPRRADEIRLTYPLDLNR